MYYQTIDIADREFVQCQSERYPIQIVIVNWNTSHLLRQCLQSIYDTCKNIAIDVFVVDNASTDDSVRVVRESFPDVILIENSKNMGFAAANNQALANNHYKYILFLNSDTILHGTVVHDTFRFLDAHPDIGLLGCKIKNDDGTPQLSCRRYPSIQNLFLQLVGVDRLTSRSYFQECYERASDAKSAVDVDTISGCAMFVRRSALRNVGLLDESFFFFGEETDWCLRFRRSGWRVAYAKTGDITHLGGKSASKLNYQRELMLTSALVMLHRKHGGIFAAGCAWLILFLFALSRFLFFANCFAMSGDNHHKLRRNKFFKVMLKYKSTWPRSTTYNPFGT